MSANPEPQVTPNMIEEARKHIAMLYNEVARLTDQELTPAEYFGEFLKRVLLALSAPAGAVWMRTAQGHLQLQYQIELRLAGLEQSEVNRQSHDELLRQAFQQGRPFYLPPHSGLGTPENGGAAAGNPSDFLVLMAPVKIDNQTVGLVEVWQRPDHPPNALPGFMQLLVRMTELSSQYVRRQHMRQMMGQQQLWVQLETFARQIHGSLNPTETAYLIANESRRLIECDRVSVAVRYGGKTVIEAISGADVVEKRSNLVQLMRDLCTQVMKWGDKLVYRGVQDESLPPGVVKALNEFLAESPSKLLAVLPLKDDREEKSTKPPRSALVMEAFDPQGAPEQMVTRMEVIGKHATSALYNSSEHKRIPMRWLWMPMAKVQEGLGGTARAIMAGVAAGLLVLACVLVFVQYPLKMDAKGQLLPMDRRWVYTPREGKIIEIFENVKTSATVAEKQALILMQDLELGSKLTQLAVEINGATGELATLRNQLTSGQTEQERQRIRREIQEKEVTRVLKSKELYNLRDQTNADLQRGGGYFTVTAPIKGTILNADFRETLGNRMVKPSDPLIRIGDKDKDWEIELKIPEKHIGQVLQAFAGKGPDEELDVDLLVTSIPTQIFKGKLRRDKIAGEAVPNKDDANESEPVVLASVRIDGPGIPASERIPREILLTGTEVHSKIRCGNHAMGYSLFYGVWEFLYEKVIFFF